MQEQTQTPAQAALKALDQMYAYYQAEPRLVKAAEDDRQDQSAYSDYYYRAA